MANIQRNKRNGNEEKKPFSNDQEICELEHLRKLFVGGLAPTTTEEGLKEYYSQFGELVEVLLMRDPTTKKSRGFGFVTYTKSHMVDTAQENRPHIIDKKAIDSKRVLLRPERETNVSVRILFVGGIKETHDDNCLKEYFSTFGNVLSVKILTDKNTGKRRGFAYIEFDDYDAVDKAILQKPHSINQIVVDVKKSVYQDIKNRAQNSTESNGSINNSDKSIFIGGLKEVHDQNCLKDHFSRCGHVVSVKILTDKNTGKRRGFAFVEFNDHGAVERAIAQKPHTIRNIMVDVKKSIYQDTKGSQNGSNNENKNSVDANAAQSMGNNMPPPNFNYWGPPPQNWNWYGPWGCPPPGMFGGQAPPNFGSDYQQNYGGGPSKNNNLGGNKMNPYNVPSNSNYSGFAQNGKFPSPSSS